jgi:hypothetical protein
MARIALDYGYTLAELQKLSGGGADEAKLLFGLTSRRSCHGVLSPTTSGLFG